MVLVCGSYLAIGPSVSADDCTADLQIHDALKTPTPVAEAKEETRGAFAVLNRNDTDKDDEEDLGQTTVAGEVDLMRLVLKQTSPASVMGTLVADSSQVKLWTAATKGTEVEPDEPGGNMWTFDALPQKLWVEGVEHSTTLRDLAFTFTGYHLHPQPPPAPPPTPVPCGFDAVTATIVWAELVSARHGNGAQPWNGFTDPPRQALNRRCGGGFGLRPIADAPRGVANCIGMQFVVFPKDVTAQKNVVFDVTRQRQQRTWQDFGDGFELKVAVDFPPGDKPNDDLNDDEEVDSSTKPTADGHMFSIDGPGPTGNKAGGERLDQRFNMLEFIRVRFDGGAFGGSRVDGSRCSAKFAWHAAHRLRAVRPAPGSPDVWVRTTENEDAGRNDVGPGHIPLTK